MTTKQCNTPPTSFLQQRLETMTEPAKRDGEKKPSGTCTRSIQEIVTIESKELLRGGREVHILHKDEIYRLLVTRNNKLILQK